MTDPRRLIPSVDALLGDEAFQSILDARPRGRVTRALRSVIDEVRAILGQDADALEGDVEAASTYARRVRIRLDAEDVPSLKATINATGVVIHTNLGRAPIALAAVEAMTEAAGEYSNLEFDLNSGARGSRYDHCVDLLRELTGAEDALVVNNCAAALMLMLSTVARGRRVAVSRGELVEIGGGFRIPEVMERSGAGLEEVGSTNRTRRADYANACDASDVAALMKVHRSNFRISGFTEEVELDELVALGQEQGIPVLHDLGSGLFVPAGSLGLPDEPTAAQAIDVGVDLVTVSGDKLFGGPQAGMIVGSSSWIARLRKNPMCRALRVDKVTLAGLEATLRLYRDPGAARREIPVLRMLSLDADALKVRAEALHGLVEDPDGRVTVVPTVGAVGGGTYPEVELPSWGVAVDPPRGAQDLMAALRSGTPPLIGRVLDDRVLLDVRTILPGQEPLVAGALSALLTS